MRSILVILDYLLQFYSWIVIAQVVFSWLYMFGVVNPRNDAVNMIGRFLYQATEPVYRPIRNILPNLGGFDLSPVVVLLAIWFLRMFIPEMAYKIGLI